MNIIVKDQLPIPLDQHLESVYAPNTERVIKSDTAIYWSWCARHRENGYTAEAVARFVADIGEVRKVSTVRRYIASLRMFFNARGGDNPARSGYRQLVAQAAGEGEISARQVSARQAS